MSCPWSRSQAGPRTASRACGRLPSSIPEPRGTCCCTDIGRDGMLSGPNFDAATTRTRSSACRTPNRRRRAAFRASSDLERLRTARGDHRQGAVGRPHSRSRRHLALPARRIIPCLDVKDGRVVKGVQFRDHRDAGDIVEQAHALSRRRRRRAGLLRHQRERRRAHASTSTGCAAIARVIDIPFAVAGGIRTSRRRPRPASTRARTRSRSTRPRSSGPELIDELARDFGSQCVVLGVDSYDDATATISSTNIPAASETTPRHRLAHARLGARRRGARRRRDRAQLHAQRRRAHRLRHRAHSRVVEAVTVPVIASGGAGTPEHFRDAFAGRRERRAGRDRLPRPVDRHPDLKEYLATMRDRNAPLTRRRHRRARLGQDGWPAARGRAGRALPAAC